MDFFLLLSFSQNKLNSRVDTGLCTNHPQPVLFGTIIVRENEVNAMVSADLIFLGFTDRNSARCDSCRSISLVVLQARQIRGSIY